jgi:hypothetical protein
MDAHPRPCEAIRPQLGDHRVSPAVQIIQDEHQIRVVFGAHGRPGVLVTSGVGTCGVRGPAGLRVAVSDFMRFAADDERLLFPTVPRK